MEKQKEIPITYKGKEIGFISEGKVFLVYCCNCIHENYAPAVASGQCAWCGMTYKVGDGRAVCAKKRKKET